MTLRCPYCRNELPRGASVCGYCRAELIEPSDRTRRGAYRPLWLMLAIAAIVLIAAYYYLMR
jgi:predicted nucleic acid-binding Zn ribbon protein